jgi:hypothetical protein
VEKKRLAEEAKAVEMKRCEEQRAQQVIYNAQVLPVTLALILFFSLSQQQIRVKKRWKIETGSMLSFVQVTAEKIIVKAKEEALMITAKANQEAQKSIADAAMKTEQVSESSV